MCTRSPTPAVPPIHCVGSPSNGPVVSVERRPETVRVTKTAEQILTSLAKYLQ